MILSYTPVFFESGSQVYCFNCNPCRAASKRNVAKRASLRLGFSIKTEPNIAIIPNTATQIMSSFPQVLTNALQVHSIFLQLRLRPAKKPEPLLHRQIGRASCRERV